MLLSIWTLFFALIGTVLWLYHEALKWFFVFLTTRTPGPTLWDLVTVHLKRLLSDDLLNCLFELSSFYDYKPWCIWFHGDYVTFVCDSESISEIAKSKHLSDKPDCFYDSFKKFIGDGLVNLNGAVHRRHRKILTPSFRKNILESHLPYVNKEADKHVNLLREKADGKSFDMCRFVEVQSIAMSFIFIISGEYIYPNIQDLAAMFKTALALIHERAVNPIKYWLSRSHKKTESMVRAALVEYNSIILEQKSLADGRLQNEDGTPGNHFELMCKKTPEGDDYFSEQEYMDETKTLLAAGAETTSGAQKACLLLLSLFPEEQQRVYEEVYEVFGESDRPAQMEDLARLVYLEMCIKEALRLFPPTPLLARLVNKETVLRGAVLPKGSMVTMNLYVLHRDPKVFKDPLKFDPMRFSAEQSEKRHPFAYIPFSVGVRNCPGQQQAFMVMKTYLSHVIRNFKILPGDDLKTLEDVKVKMQFVLHLPEFSVRLISRKPKS